MINPNNHLTLIEAAKPMGVSTQTVRRLIQREVVTAQQSLGPHGIRWEIDRADLIRYLEATQGGQHPLLTPINNLVAVPAAVRNAGFPPGKCRWWLPALLSEFHRICAFKSAACRSGPREPCPQASRGFWRGLNTQTR